MLESKKFFIEKLGKRVARADELAVGVAGDVRSLTQIGHSGQKEPILVDARKKDNLDIPFTLSEAPTPG